MTAPRAINICSGSAVALVAALWHAVMPSRSAASIVQPPAWSNSIAMTAALGFDAAHSSGVWPRRLTRRTSAAPAATSSCITRSLRLAAATWHGVVPSSSARVASPPARSSRSSTASLVLDAATKHAVRPVASASLTGAPASISNSTSFALRLAAASHNKQSTLVDDTLAP